MNGKELSCQCRRHKRHTFDPWVGRIPWRRAWQPTPVFLPGQSYGQRSLWWVHRVAKSQTGLKQLSMHTRWIRDNSFFPSAKKPNHYIFKCGNLQYIIDISILNKNWVSYFRYTFFLTCLFGRNYINKQGSIWIVLSLKCAMP